MTEIELLTQERNRDYDLYRYGLCINENKQFYDDKSILVIGGGYGVYCFDAHLNANITNVDLNIPKDYKQHKKIKSVENDFTRTSFSRDSFDEVWALLSLPHYSTSCIATKLFFLKSALSLKPGGIMRVCPGVHSDDPAIKASIKRNDSSAIIYDTFHQSMNEFAQIGGISSIIWQIQNNNKLKNTFYELDNAPPAFKNADKYKNISHFATTVKCICCAIVLKPEYCADKINDFLELQIAQYEKLHTDKINVLFSGNTVRSY